MKKFKLFNYILPSVISMVIVGTYTNIDGLFIGNRAGDDGLAAQRVPVFRRRGLRQLPRADDLEAVVHGCTSASRTACSARMRGSICSLIVWAMMLHRMTSAPESRLSSISRL